MRWHEYEWVMGGWALGMGGPFLPLIPALSSLGHNVSLCFSVHFVPTLLLLSPFPLVTALSCESQRENKFP